VPVGATVTWTWTGANPHDVLFTDGTTNKSVVQRTGTYTRQFPGAGTYDYHCSVHGLGMSGRVTVQ
jgi:plastocyanin